MKVGSFLLAMGHRNVAFFAGNPGTTWSVNRYRGIKKVFESTSAHATVTSYDIPSLANQMKLFKWETPEIKRFRQSMEPLAQEMRQFGVLHNLSERQVYQIYEPLFHSIRNARFANQLAQVYENVIAEIVDKKEISAIVCDSDRMAAVALKLLKLQRQNVPKDISLIGFDDSYDALVDNISSYNFNNREQISCVLNWLLHPEQPSKATLARKRFESVGSITRRGSVADIRKSG